MRSPRFSFVSLVFTSLTSVALANAASFTGTVTNKTNGKPSAGDTVVLVDVQAGMSDAASATTNSAGKYTLESPGMGPYLIRVNHQGGTYFIAAPQGGGAGDITVYDVAAKVDGVGIDADMLLVEAGGGMLRVHERYLVRNASLPPKAQFSNNTFEVVIPTDAELDGASATRPGGLGTNTHLLPLGPKGHYSFNVPIQPNQGKRKHSSKFNITSLTTGNTRSLHSCKCQPITSWSTRPRGSTLPAREEPVFSLYNRIQRCRHSLPRMSTQVRPLDSRSPVKDKCRAKRRALEWEKRRWPASGTQATGPVEV